jgi:hypothetical protein
VASPADYQEHTAGDQSQRARRHSRVDFRRAVDPSPRRHRGGTRDQQAANPARYPRQNTLLHGSNLVVNCDIARTNRTPILTRKTVAGRLMS